MLLQPYPGLPAATPAALGATLAAGLLLAAHLGQRGFRAIAAPVRGAAMVLLYLAALRLYFFGRAPAVVLDSYSGRAILLLAVAINACVAWRHRSFRLVLLALAMSCATLIAIDSGELLVVALPSLAVAVVAAARRRDWPALPLAAIPLLYATYAVWAIGNPFRGGRFRYVGEPPVAPGLLLATAAVFAAGCLFRRQRDHEDGVSNTQALIAFGDQDAFLVPPPAKRAAAKKHQRLRCRHQSMRSECAHLHATTATVRR